MRGGGDWQHDKEKPVFYEPPQLTGDNPGGVPDNLSVGSEVMIDDVVALSQYPDYPTGCESVSLYILLNHYGVDVSVEDIVEALPKGPVPYEDCGVAYGADPEREFVGDPRDDMSYGVFEEPIQATADGFLEGAKCRVGAEIEDIISIIDGGDPVMAWCAISEDRAIEFTRHWLDCRTGKTITWASGEHAVVVYGYSDAELYISDPNTGSLRTVSRSDFEVGFTDLGGRIVYYE